MAEIDGDLAEFQEVLDRLREEDEEELAEPLINTIRSLKQLREVLVELHQIYLDGPESAGGKLEQRVEKLSALIENGYEYIDLLGELGEAYKEDDEERIDEVRRELEEFIKEKTDFEGKPELSDERTTSFTGPTLRPILVNDNDLKAVGHLSFDEGVVPLLKAHCFECHNDETQSGDINLEFLVHQRPFVRERAKWTNVLAQTQNRVMPLDEGQQPTEKQRRQIVFVLNNAISNFDYSGIDDPGYEQARRLTHHEYDNTIRDLFGGDVKTASQFPSDLTGTSGFDNSANTLFLQPLLMERYQSAAEKVLTSVLPPKPMSIEQQNAFRLIFGDSTSDASSDAAKGILRKFQLRAYRRPPTFDELARACHQYQTARDSGLGFQDAVKVALNTTLISPNVLLKTESNPSTQAAFSVSDWELASRLSYFP